MNTPNPCWASYHEQWEYGSAEWAIHGDDPGATCLLPEGHLGPHQWTPNSDIIIRLTPAPDSPTDR